MLFVLCHSGTGIVTCACFPQRGPALSATGADRRHRPFCSIRLLQLTRLVSLTLVLNPESLARPESKLSADPHPNSTF